MSHPGKISSRNYKKKKKLTKGKGRATGNLAMTSNNLKAKTSKLPSTTLCKILTDHEKQQLNEMFEKLDPNKFWTLQATEKEASKKKEKPIAVEEKMMEFARSCNYRQ